MLHNSKVFLSADWNNLILFNYAVNDDVLASRLPEGCELDRYEGKAYLSLVAFQFLNTRVFGVKWPGLTNFPEINLRFYVKYKGTRGVVFIKEYVPSRLVAQFARSLYNEPYQAAKMQDTVILSSEKNSILYTIQDRHSKLKIQANLHSQSILPAETSVEHFFKEHDLGVGRDRRQNTVTYRVSHPHWKTRTVLDYQLDVDWAGLYGQEFAFLGRQSPCSVVFAEGSAIQVFYADKTPEVAKRHGYLT